jgi:hypothetical protein
LNLSRAEGPWCKTRGINRFGIIFQLEIPWTGSILCGLEKQCQSTVDRGLHTTAQLAVVGPSGRSEMPFLTADARRGGGRAEGNLTAGKDELCGLGIWPAMSLKCGDLLSSMGRSLGHGNGGIERGFGNGGGGATWRHLLLGLKGRRADGRRRPMERIEDVGYRTVRGGK